MAEVEVDVAGGPVVGREARSVWQSSERPGGGGGGATLLLPVTQVIQRIEAQAAKSGNVAHLEASKHSAHLGTFPIIVDCGLVPEESWRQLVEEEEEEVITCLEQPASTG